MKSPTASDLATAASGGCIDIPRGATVSVQKAFRNTALVTYQGATLTVPVIDFVPAAGANPAAAEIPAQNLPGGVPQGYAVEQRLAAGGGHGPSLVLLLDRRIVAALRNRPTSDQTDTWDYLFGGDNPNAAALERTPPLNAQLMLLSSTSQVIARETLERPLASLRPAPIHGLPATTFLLTVDFSSDVGATGPDTELLAPAQQGLTPASATTARGTNAGTVVLASNTRAAWQIVPARSGGTEEIKRVSCSFTAAGGVEVYDTYRFRAGHWVLASRQAPGGCDDVESFPDRAKFP